MAGVVTVVRIARSCAPSPWPLAARLMLAWCVAVLSGASGLAVAAGQRLESSGDLPMAWVDVLALAEEVVLPGAEVGAAIVTLSRFSDRRDVAALVSAVRDAWQDERAPVMQSRRAGWTQLTRLVDGVIETVEIRPVDGDTGTMVAPAVGIGTEGRIIRIRRREAAAADASEHWLRRALVDVHEPEPPVTHRDGGRVLTTRVALTAAGVEPAARSVERVLRQAGFSPGLASPPSAPGRDGSAYPSAQRRGRALMFVKPGEEVAVTVSDHGAQRAVVLHWGRRP